MSTVYDFEAIRKHQLELKKDPAAEPTPEIFTDIENYSGARLDNLAALWDIYRIGASDEALRTKVILYIYRSRIYPAGNVVPTRHEVIKFRE